MPFRKSKTRDSRRFLHRLGAWAAGLGLIAGVLRLGGCADRLFFVPSREHPTTPPGVEDATFTTADGVRLHGWLMKPQTGTGPFPVIVHAHGNAGNVESHADFSRCLTRHGFAVLLFDYRGYGKSDPRTPTRDSLVTDTLAAIDFVASRSDQDPARLGVLGISLGGVPASAAAAERPIVRALALVTAYSSWARVAHDHMPVVGPILIGPGRDPIDAVENLGKRPLLLVHGMRDRVVPFHHVGRLADAARATGVPVEITEIPQADHNDIMDFAAYEASLAAFFTTHLGATSDGKPLP
jgi:dipeptidyl aminopeptidase/acylaminoacyl peptidase